jgi:hypothetical protein
MGWAVSCILWPYSSGGRPPACLDQVPVWMLWKSRNLAVFLGRAICGLVTIPTELSSVTCLGQKQSNKYTLLTEGAWYEVWQKSSPKCYWRLHEPWTPALEAGQRWLCVPTAPAITTHSLDGMLPCQSREPNPPTLSQSLHWLKLYRLAVFREISWTHQLL